MANHSQTTVDKYIPADEQDSIIADLVVRARSQTDLWNEYEKKYPELSRTGFYDWCKRVLDDARCERARKLKRLIGLKHGLLDDVDPNDLDERLNTLVVDKILVHLQDDEEVDSKDIERFSNAIRNKTRGRVLTNEDRRRQEAHRAKYREEMKAAVDAAKGGDGKVDAAMVSDLLDKALRGEALS